MLEDKRIKEAQENIKKNLEDGLILKYKTFNPNISETYNRNYIESIKLAEEIFKQNLSNLWVIVVSYYSMYYIANAVLYRLGYKIGTKISHKITSDALIVFVRNKLKKELLEKYETAKEEALEIEGKRADEIIEHFHKELEKRSIFQYESTEEIKKAKAETSLKRSKEFIFEMKKLL